MSNKIDKIIYINLNKNTDRREQIEKELNTYNLPFERFEAIENRVSGIGCAKSHLQVLKIAKERNYENILILEDDFTFLVSKEEFEEQLTNFFNLNIEYDVCMLSYNLIRHQNTSHNFIVKALEVQTASGYIVNKKYYNKLIDLYEVAVPLLEQTHQHWIYANDQIWKQYQEKDNWYCFSTRIGKQRPGYNSDGAYCDYNC
jgi:glycosyl transferase family 25